jgi:hypothetical protein
VADVRLLRDLIGRGDSVVARGPRLAIGIEPAFADFTAHSDLTPEFIRRYIDTQIKRLRGLGYDAVSCLVDLREIVAETVEAALKSRRFDCVVDA